MASSTSKVSCGFILYGDLMGITIPRPQNREELFNLRHAALCNIIEHIFGVLKRQFRVLQIPLEYDMYIQAKLPLVLCALHNFIRRYDPDDFLTLNFPNLIYRLMGDLKMRNTLEYLVMGQQMLQNDSELMYAVIPLHRRCGLIINVSLHNMDYNRLGHSFAYLKYKTIHLRIQRTAAAEEYNILAIKCHSQCPSHLLCPLSQVCVQSLPTCMPTSASSRSDKACGKRWCD